MRAAAWPNSLWLTQEKHRRETSKIGRLLSLYVDDSVPDPPTFGEVRRRAWKIMPREALKSTAQRMSVKLRQ